MTGRVVEHAVVKLSVAPGEMGRLPGRCDRCLLALPVLELVWLPSVEYLNHARLHAIGGFHVRFERTVLVVDANLVVVLERSIEQVLRVHPDHGLPSLESQQELLIA